MYNKENLSRLNKMEQLAPEVMKAFWAFDKASVAEGAIPVKFKELIAVAVALTTQCPAVSRTTTTMSHDAFQMRVCVCSVPCIALPSPLVET